MSDIISTFLSSNSSLKRNKFQNKFIAESNKVFLDNGLRLSKEGNMLQIPKFNINSKFITENNNKIFEDLNINTNKNNEILIIDDLGINNNLFKNEFLNDLNTQDNKTEKMIKKYNKMKVKTRDEYTADKNMKIKSKYENKYLNSENNNIDKNKINRKQLIEKYIDSLLKKEKTKTNKFYEATKKIESNKFSLANSINPKKYIQKNILDDSFGYNDFKTTKIQDDCFNGNKKFREANYKNIKINLMNNVFLNSMSATPKETGMQFIIDKMIAEQNHINNFNFSKQIYNRKDEETLNVNNNIKFL